MPCTYTEEGIQAALIDLAQKDMLNVMAMLRKTDIPRTTLNGRCTELHGSQQAANSELCQCLSPVKKLEKE